MTIADLTERDRFDALATEIIERTQGTHPVPEAPNGLLAGALISAAVLHGVGSRMGGAAGGQMAKAANEFAADLLDDICGPPPGPHPHGPGPHLIASLGETVAVLPANSRLAASIRGIAFAAAARTFGLGEAGSDPMPAHGH